MGDHYVSQFLLEYFEIAGGHNRKQIYSYVRGGEKPEIRAIKRMAQEENFNTPEIESDFQKLETLVSLIIVRLNQGIMNLTNEEKEELCEYIGLLISNTPWSLKRQERMLYEHPEEITDQITSNGSKVSNPDKVINHIADNADKVFKDTNMEVAKDLKDRLKNRSWKLAIAPKNHFFIISDNPISSTPLPETPYEWTDGFINYPIVLPLSPQNCLYIIDDGSADSEILVNAETVRMINEYTCFFAQERVFSHVNSSEIQEMLDKTDGNSDDIIVNYPIGITLDPK